MLLIIRFIVVCIIYYFSCLIVDLPKEEISIKVKLTTKYEPLHWVFIQINNTRASIVVNFLVFTFKNH